MDPEQLGVTVIDDKTLQVELEAIVPYFLKPWYVLRSFPSTRHILSQPVKIMA